MTVLRQKAIWMEIEEKRRLGSEAGLLPIDTEEIMELELLAIEMEEDEEKREELLFQYRQKELRQFREQLQPTLGQDRLFDSYDVDSFQRVVEILNYNQQEYQLQALIKLVREEMKKNDAILEETSFQRETEKISNFSRVVF